MKKTVNITMGGRPFIIEEDGYELLDEYLRTLNSVFSNPENTDIIQDIEVRISELFDDITVSGQAVITVDNARSVINRIGSPRQLLEIEEEPIDEEIVTFEENTASEYPDFLNEAAKDASSPNESADNSNRQSGATVPPPPPLKLTKRLYRDTSKGMIGGVCAGIAAYTGIDVTWIRLIAIGLFMLSCIFRPHMLVIMIYIILWLILPAASTPIQYMQMDGTTPTLQNIGQSVNSYLNRSAKVTPIPTDPITVKSVISSILGVIAKIAVILMLIILIPIELGLIISGIAATVGLLVASFIYFMNPESAMPLLEYPFFGAPFPTTAAILGSILSGAVMFGIPFYYIIKMLVSKPNYNLSSKTNITAIVFWIFSIIGFALCCARWYLGVQSI